MIVPNRGDKVVLMRMGKFILYSVISRVHTFNPTTNTWEVDVVNGNKNELYYQHINEPDYFFNDVAATLRSKDYASNDWEIVT